jgi:hypothetical protein
MDKWTLLESFQNMTNGKFIIDHKQTYEVNLSSACWCTYNPNCKNEIKELYKKLETYADPSRKLIWRVDFII